MAQLAPTVRLMRHDHCSTCGHVEVCLWEAECGCWVSKCLKCGVVGWVDCGDEFEEHWNLFEQAANDLI